MIHFIQYTSKWSKINWGLIGSVMLSMFFTMSEIYSRVFVNYKILSFSIYVYLGNPTIRWTLFKVYFHCKVICISLQYMKRSKEENALFPLLCFFFNTRKLVRGKCLNSNKLLPFIHYYASYYTKNNKLQANISFKLLLNQTG